MSPPNTTREVPRFLHGGQLPRLLVPERFPKPLPTSPFVFCPESLILPIMRSLLRLDLMASFFLPTTLPAAESSPDPAHALGVRTPDFDVPGVGGRAPRLAERTKWPFRCVIFQTWEPATARR